MDEMKVLYLIVEGKTDAAILHTLLDCRKYQKVYHIPTGGYGNISSVARTIRLMRSPMDSNDKIIIAFDADSFNEQIRNDRIATIRYLTNADVDKRIGVFCFIPTIDQYLFHPKCNFNKNEMDKLVDYLKEHLTELKEMGAIKDMQAFLDE